MTNDLDKIRKAFEAEGQPLPREDARAADISSAMKAFDEEFSAEHQGSAEAGRLMNTDDTVFNSFWRRLMTPISQNMKPLLLGGVSLAVLSVAVINMQILQKDPAFNDIGTTSEVLPKDAPATKPAEVAEKITLEEKVEERNRKGQSRLNDADGNQIANDNRGDAAQLQAIIGDEAGSGTTTAFRKEADIVAKTDDRLASGNKKRAQKLSSDLSAQAPSLSAPSNEPLGRELLKPNKQVGGTIGELKKSEVTSGERVAGAGRASEAEIDSVTPAPVTIPGVSSKTIASKEVVSRRKSKVADLKPAPTYQDQGRDKFEEVAPNPVKVSREEPLSTFSIDVDTASYAFMRASLNRHRLPQANAVRVEELINYFPYAYEAPDDRGTPFSTHVTVMPTPWNTHTKLMHIGIKGYELPKGDRPQSNLVFLIDTSGSMNAPNKLPLLRNSFEMMLSSLQPDDTVAIVTYAGRAGTVLEPTKVRDRHKINEALRRLRSGGSTAGAAGIQRAYELAERNFEREGVNRVILATDGDFNVGMTDKGQLKTYIEQKRKTGISLSVLGFGMGNYNDALMQTLAQNGNGNASYIDNLSEAQKVLVEEAGSTLFTIAKDVKIQVEFNPQTVSEYRLIGYETRKLRREDFNNDKIDAGEIGAGHRVTAIYEITPAGSENRLVDDLRYQPKKKSKVVEEVQSDEYALLKLRYKLPDSDTSTKVEYPVTPAVEVDGIANAPQETRFATAVAAFGQILRGGRFTGSFNYDDVINLARKARGEDEFGYRSEFIRLVKLARSAGGQRQIAE